MRRLSYHLLAILALALLPATRYGSARAADTKERLPIGEFAATRIAAPKLDGKIAAGEWDRALTSSGMIAPFDFKLLEAVTRMSFGFDEKNFYFLFQCRRGNYEWKLWKGVRDNDDYAFSDPSIEVWVSPPTLVPETYQNIINTYPAVLDQQMIPTRGYTAQGWRGNWTVGVSESDTEYIIEAAIPISDFGFPTVKDGDVWRFLFCRTCPGAKPRPQGSWSITQGFNEIASHPAVRLQGDGPVVQLFDVVSVFTGKYRFPMAAVAAQKAPAEITAELVFHAGVRPTKDDPVSRQTLKLAAGARQEFVFEGAVPAGTKAGNFTISATTKDGAVLFRQTFPYDVSGFIPQPPQRPEKAPPAEELVIDAKYGPETSTVIVRADIIDLPTREQVAKAKVRVLEPGKDKPLVERELPGFRHWYATTSFTIDGAKLPVYDDKKINYVRNQNAELEKKNRDRAKKGEAPLPLQPLPAPDPLKVQVEVAVYDAAGAVLKQHATELPLLRYRFEWQDNQIGITDNVIPPWTPVGYLNGLVSVWNREQRLDGLGLTSELKNGGVNQGVQMRLLAIKDGVEVPIRATAPTLARQVDAEVRTEGAGRGAGLLVSARTRVEFDGFTRVDWTLAPEDKTAKLDQLFLEITLPASEATHFCTTAGGWAAVHDATPAHWTSLQTASGMLVRDFVPYLWFTNSDRAFLFATDSDRGWLTDTEKKLPTEEFWLADGKLRLVVRFIEIASELTAPTSLSFGYQAFPSRPLPAGWRTIVCGQRPANLPSARGTYFWHEGDWAVLWPYYCSPYPWNLEKSRATYERFPRTTLHRPMVGSIAHSIGRYRDFEGNSFPTLAVDWATTPGQIGNSDVTQSKGPNDFRLHHYQRWVREADFRGLYIDENYLALEENYLTGNAWFTPDGRLQRAYSYLGLRDYYKRMRVMFHQNRVPAPVLWMHMSSGAAFHAWLGDIFFEGENVEPTNEQWDYLEVLPAARMRAIGSAVCAGGVMTMMCQSQRHATSFEAKHTHQFVGWTMAHDIVPEQVRFHELIAQEGRLYEDRVDFLPYWKDSTPLKTPTPACVVSAHRVGKRALLWVVNTSRADQQVEVKVEFAKLGFDPRKTIAVDAETGARVPVTAAGFSVAVAQRDFVALHLIEQQLLKGEATYFASFDQGRDTDEALGNPVLLTESGAAPALVESTRGKAIGLDDGLVFPPHLHLRNDRGRLLFRLSLADDPQGRVLTAGPLTLALVAGKTPALTLTYTPAQKDAAPVTATAPVPDDGWRVFDLSWGKGQAVLTVDGKEAAKLALPAGASLGIAAGTGHDLEKGGTWAFGGRRNRGILALDDLSCFLPAE